MKVRGVRQVIGNLNKEIKKIEGDTRLGLMAAGIFIENEAKEITPHDKGVLVSSAYHHVDRVGNDWALRVGYTAKYAPHVHEMPNSVNWSKPDTGNKFLFKAVFNNEANILRIIKNRIQF
jgi:hypothetical protein